VSCGEQIPKNILISARKGKISAKQWFRTVLSPK
jgi:hypothetical protein